MASFICFQVGRVVRTAMLYDGHKITIPAAATNIRIIEARSPEDIVLVKERPLLLMTEVVGKVV